MWMVKNAETVLLLMAAMIAVSMIAEICVALWLICYFRHGEDAMRYTRSCHDHPEEIGKSWSVCFDPPMSESGDGVPKCEIKEASNDVADTKGRAVADGLPGQRD